MTLTSKDNLHYFYVRNVDEYGKQIVLIQKDDTVSEATEMSTESKRPFTPKGLCSYEDKSFWDNLAQDILEYDVREEHIWTYNPVVQTRIHELLLQVLGQTL